ncbi:MAG TPA: hypothetical protein PLD25_17690 [Chloroflexota bacterium]|nr:hypothetical protein [Chloroflexota bacterium]
MEQSYQRWPFLPSTMRTPEQNQQWWEHCFLPVLPVENFAQAGGSTAVTSLPGNGKSVALEYMVRHTQQWALHLRYPTVHWPHGARPRIPAKGHLSQIMSILALETATHLEAQPQTLAVNDLNDTQHEFLAWLVEKYLGRRALVRLAQRLQQTHQATLKLPPQFTDIYPTDTGEGDVWGQIGEAAELAKLLGFAQINLLIDLNEMETSLFREDLTDLFSRLDFLEHADWLLRSALPQSDVIESQVLPCVNGRLYPMRLEYMAADIDTIVSRHVQAATDGRVQTIESLADTAVLERARQEIITLYGAETLAGWLNWTETLLHLQAGSGGVVRGVDTAVTTYYKRHIHLRLDEKKQGLWRGPQFIPLENQPFEMMKMLFEKRGNPAPEALYQIAGSVANLNTIANRLRQKVEPIKGKTNVYLHNRRDQGYWLENFLI